MKLQGRAGELVRRVEIAETRQVLRYALRGLTEPERWAIEAFLAGLSDREAGIRLSRGARDCLETLRRYGQRIFPKQATLARRMHRTRQAVSGYLRELRSADLVQVVRVTPTQTAYILKNQYVREMFFTSLPPLKKTRAMEHRKQALAKMRVNLTRLGIQGVGDLLSEGG